MSIDLFMPVGRIGDYVVTLLDVSLAVGLLVLVVFFVLMLSAMKAARQRAAAVNQQLNDMMRIQAEMTGRMQSLADSSTAGYSNINRNLNERLDQVGHRLGQSLEANAKSTTQNLGQLNERLAVIDRAQKNITELSSQVVSLQDILSNKQQRGAFGQGRMEAIIEDGLPKDAYTFQATLSNNRRPDCLIHLPNSSADIVIDAKFPLESFELFKSADTSQSTKEAIARVRGDVSLHIKDISEKYFIPGETQDTAMMFVPSESIYADLHENFADLIQKAYRARIVIVSPNMMMLAISTMQAILKDAKMREQAALIQTEVTRMMEDVGRLHDRVQKLDRHFGQATQDIEQILISSDKVSKRGQRIEQLDLPETAEAEAQPVPIVKPVEISDDQLPAKPKSVTG